ncbi:hypothetical protein VTN77DRAFT_7101 [Rasamsonia byssochlamydoides]|uniref:uncharacterized protein n=1 Tax=Rasamsonia byssochlamydoides TaxID=89139 RepID=UPI003742027A
MSHYVSSELSERIRTTLWSQLAPVQMEALTVNLANVLPFLDSDFGIPLSMLRRAGTWMRTWDSNGEPRHIDPVEAGLERDLVFILSDEGRLQQAIDELQFHSLVTLDREQRLSMYPGSRAMYRQSMLDPDRWKLQAVLLVCHAFPRDAYLEPEFGDLGRAQVPQVWRILQHFDSLEATGKASVQLKHAMVPTLLASSRFSGMAWKSRAIKRAQEILADPQASDPYLEMMLKARQSDLRRLFHAEWDGISYKTEQDKLDKRLNALVGEVCLSTAADYLQNDEDLDKALLTLQEIQPVDRDNISTLEELALQKKAIAWGRIRRYQGRFHEARQVLEAVYNSGSLPEGVVPVSASNCDLVSHLAAVLCELGEPYQAEILLTQKIDSIQSPGLRELDRVQRLKLALAEAVLQQGEYWRAQDIYLDLSRHIRVVPARPESVMSVSRLDMGLARVQHVQGNWASALKYWEQALRTYENFPEAKGFGTVIVYASIAYVKNQLGDVAGSTVFADKAQELFKVTGRRHWFTRLGTEWLNRVMPVSNQIDQENNGHDS